MPTENAHQRYLAELPNSWSICDLRALGSIVGGSTPSRAISRFWNGNIPWVTPGEMTALVGTKFLNDTRERITRAGYESCGTRLLPPGSLLITTRATLGLVALAGCEVSTNQGFKSVVFCRDNYPDFYFHLFHRLKPEMERLASGTTFLEISAGDFGRITIPVPPPSEQRAIAAVLDTIDDAIQKTEQIIAKLQQVKQGLLHDLLTRGIDDNGELRDPERHPEQFQDSPLGRIPRGWRVGSIGEFCEVYNYLREPISEELRAQKPGPFPYYGPTGILDHINEWRVEGEFVLIGEDGDHFLKFASWPMTQLVRGRFNVNNHAHILCGKPDCRTHWVDTFFRHRDITLHTTRQGAGRFKLNKAALLTLPILVPSLLEQDHITTHFQTVESRIAADGRRLTKLQNLKAGLSDDLLTGRVRTTSLPGFSA